MFAAGKRWGTIQPVQLWRRYAPGARIRGRFVSLTAPAAEVLILTATKPPGGSWHRKLAPRHHLHRRMGFP